mgnify:CR=1 FL=1
MAISVIITAFKEPRTIGKAISAIEKQISKKAEILVVAPDKETLEAAKKVSIKNKQIKILKNNFMLGFILIGIILAGVWGVIHPVLALGLLVASFLVHEAIADARG